MKTFINSLPIIAKAIGRRYDVRIVIGGSQACTDGKTIYLPSLPAEKEGLDVLLNGYLDHEASHCRHTDFGLEMAKEPFHNWLQQVLEDIRHEKAMGEIYPGCKTNLANLQARLIADGTDAAPRPDSDPRQMLSSYLYYTLRHGVVGQDCCKEYADKAKEYAQSVFPKELFGEITDAMFEIKQAKSTQDAFDIAQRLRDMFDNPEQPESPEDNAQHGQSSEGDDSESESQDNADQGSAPDNDADDTNDDADKADSGSSSQSGPDKDGDDTQVGESDASSDSDDGDGGDSDTSSNQGDSDDESKRRKALRDAISGNAEDYPKLTGEKVAAQLEQSASGDASPMAQPSDEADSSAGDQTPDAALLHDGVIDAMAVRQASARLRSRLAGLIQAERLEYSHRSRTGRRIDRRALPKLRTGDPRIFRSQISVEAVNTAVTVLLDRSSSMSTGNRIGVAREAALALTMAVEETEGVNASAFSFPGTNGIGVNTHRVDVMHRRGRRVDSGRFGIFASGGTPLTQAVWYAGWDLLLADEPRKILVVVTDGEARDPGSARDVLERLRADGVETLAIGIQTPISPTLFPEHAVIKNVSELAGQLFSMMEGKLVPAA